jgi:hypothetical protein
VDNYPKRNSQFLQEVANFTELFCFLNELEPRSGEINVINSVSNVILFIPVESNEQCADDHERPVDRVQNVI